MKHSILVAGGDKCNSPTSSQYELPQIQFEFLLLKTKLPELCMGNEAAATSAAIICIARGERHADPRLAVSNPDHECKIS